MATLLGPHPPAWGSKERINRAGDALRSGNITPEQALLLETWRNAHRYILNTFQAILRQRTRETGVIVAQRLKRRTTIIDKLLRESGMQLARMDDIAGCRLVFPDYRSLDLFRADLHRATFKHKRRNHPFKYHYIKRPRSSGYRGIHDIYEYNTSSVSGAQFNGLLLEIQYRTRCQHVWASTVELMGQLTPSEPKFDRGDPKHKEFFKLVSELFARTREKEFSVYPELSDAELLHRIERLDAEINLMAMFRLTKASTETAGAGRSVILQLGIHGLKVHAFSDRGAAGAALFKLEKAYPEDDIVLVGADNFSNIRSIYRNYFSDAAEFVAYYDEGCQMLKSAVQIIAR